MVFAGSRTAPPGASEGRPVRQGGDNGHPAVRKSPVRGERRPPRRDPLSPLTGLDILVFFRIPALTGGATLYRAYGPERQRLLHIGEVLPQDKWCSKGAFRAGESNTQMTISPARPPFVGKPKVPFVTVPYFVPCFLYRFRRRPKLIRRIRPRAASAKVEGSGTMLVSAIARSPPPWSKLVTRSADQPGVRVTVAKPLSPGCWFARVSEP